MKRLLLSVCLIGVVFAGHTHFAQSMQGPLAGEPLGSTRAASFVSGGVSEQAKFHYPGVQRIALRSSAVGASQADGTPVASIDELFAPALPQAANRDDDVKAARQDDGAGESTIWVIVTRGAWMHSGPSVSTPIVGHRSPGKEMHLLDFQQGWYQVLDPETGKRGWVFAEYYLEPIDRPGQKRVAVQAPLPPARAASDVIEPKQPARRVAQKTRIAVVQPQLQYRAPSRGEGVASLLDRAFRR
jgi:hypothetical protein